MSSEKQEKTSGCGCMAVEALVPVDDRGQMVLPKSVREKAGIRGGDKLALTTVESNGEICCIVLTKADGLAGAVRSALGGLDPEDQS
ncbi:MAG: AbrB/MazE/SpoVT family DNA-binding domain-containing protein [Candidatus Bipolaricaulota bacterium]|nr:MAG: AbrB/MazE/SpoVT family DNA-binding domain-containing protein [Candidatus Bipolaricaulota bacterium]